MSEKLTRIRLPGLPSGEGYMIWDEQTAEHMIATMRRRAANMRSVADALDAAADEDFEIMVIRGPCIQKPIRTIQAGRPA